MLVLVSPPISWAVIPSGGGMVSHPKFLLPIFLVFRPANRYISKCSTTDGASRLIADKQPGKSVDSKPTPVASKSQSG